MVYRGLVRGGVVVLDGGFQLPEGTSVTIEVVTARGVPRAQSAEALDADHMERADRLLGVLRSSSDEAMEAQRRLDRFL